MNTKTLGVFLLLLGLFCLTGSNTSSSDVIVWSENRRLSWDDFQGYPNYSYEDIAALTSSGIIHFKGCENGKIIYKVMAYFEKKESWVKQEAYTSHHLEHEQIHFDITELYARKIRKKLDEYQFQCGQEEHFEFIIQKLLKEWQIAQSNYDLNTHYSIKHKEQHVWKDKIQEELAALEAYE